MILIYTETKSKEREVAEYFGESYCSNIWKKLPKCFKPYRKPRYELTEIDYYLNGPAIFTYKLV